MILCYTHKLVPYSVIREAYSGRRWGRIETHNQTLCGGRDSKLKVSIKSFCSQLRESLKRGGRKSIRTRRYREQGNMNQVSKANMSSQRMNQYAEGLHESAPGLLYLSQLLAYYFYETSDCENIQVSDSCILVLAIANLLLLLGCCVHI